MLIKREDKMKNNLGELPKRLKDIIARNTL